MPFHLTIRQLHHFINEGTREEKNMAQWVINYRQANNPRDRKYARQVAMDLFFSLPMNKQHEIEQLERENLG